MVVIPGADEQADLIFQALADSTRRDIVRGSMSVSALARDYPMTVTVVQKHAAVLDRACLVKRARRGREQLVKSRIETINSARDLLDRFEDLWRDRIDRIDGLVADTK